jgi:hypothetical protein
MSTWGTHSTHIQTIVCPTSFACEYSLVPMPFLEKIIIIIILWHWGLNSGPCTCPLSLEPHSSPFFLFSYFFEQDLPFVSGPA